MKSSIREIALLPDTELWIQWAYLADYQQEGTDWIPLPLTSALAEQTGNTWDVQQKGR